jgi:hypothetical protein
MSTSDTTTAPLPEFMGKVLDALERQADGDYELSAANESRLRATLVAAPDQGERIRLATQLLFLSWHFRNDQPAKPRISSRLFDFAGLMADVLGIEPVQLIAHAKDMLDVGNRFAKQQGQPATVIPTKAAEGPRFWNVR